MRKRSEVVAAATDVKITKKDGMSFIECTECGLKPSVAKTQQTEPPTCPRCGADVKLTEAQLEAASKDKPKIDRDTSSPEAPTSPATPAAKREAEGAIAPTKPPNLVEQVARKPDPSDVGEEVSYTWGEEMLRFGDFMNCKIGPYSGTTRIREGETRAHAMARLQRDIDGQAKIARDAKLDEFMGTILGVKKRIERAGK